MSQNKRQKMDLGAASSSASINTQEMSPGVLDDSGDSHIAQQTSRANDRAGGGTTNENEEKAIFDENLADFKEAVKWPGFVDRSLLIKELLEIPRIVIILAPKHFGKSMNLDMVKRFFEIEGGRDVTNPPQDLEELEKFENFKAFQKYGIGRPCKILAETDIVKEHFGRHPVIHINFKDDRVSSIQEVNDTWRELVHCAYLAHPYLKNGKIFSDLSRNEDANEDCRLWCDPEEYKKLLIGSALAQLVEYLHGYHKRKVYLLVDEFDALAVKALQAGKSRQEAGNINRRVCQLLGGVVKDSVTKYILGSLITKRRYLENFGIRISDHLNNVPVYKWNSDYRGSLVAYYSLTHNELITLLEQVFPEEEQKRVSVQEEVKRLYNGYSFRDDIVYCIRSVLHYIRVRSTLDASKITNTSFWEGSSIISKMDSILRNSDIMIKLMDLTDDDYLSFTPRTKVEAQVLAKFLKESESCKSFLVEKGYLTCVLDQRENVRRRDKAIRVKIANADVLVAFQEMFDEFSPAICGLYDKCAEVFDDLPVDRDDEVFKKKIGDFYNNLETLLRKFSGEEGVNERLLRAALYTIMLKTGFRECRMEKYVAIDSETGKINLWLFDGNFANIFEMKLIKSDNDDSHEKFKEQALQKILSGNKTAVEILDQYSNVINYLLIGIIMSGKGKPYMCCLVNSLNDKDCIWINFLT